MNRLAGSTVATLGDACSDSTSIAVRDVQSFRAALVEMTRIC
jgi:hypothetical protein